MSKLLHRVRAVAIVLACLSWIVPMERLAAVEVGRVAPSSSTPVRDIALDAGGQLRGQVLDAGGTPSSGSEVIVLQGGRRVADAVADERGHFAIGGLRGGMYEVATEHAMTVCRCWVANTAPPAATDQLLLISSERVERGQRPIGDVLAHPVVIGALIAAAIAIPIAVHRSKDEPPGS